MLAASGAEHYLSVTSHVAKKISSCLQLRGAIKEVKMNSEHASQSFQVMLSIVHLWSNKEVKTNFAYASPVL